MNDRLGEIVALVAAAGAGRRLGLGPKAFLRLGGRTLLERVVETMADCAGRVVVAVPPDELERARREVGERARVIPGAASHQHTVLELLGCSREPIVLLHHVARPLASRDLCRRVIAAAREHGAAAAFLPAVTPLARVAEGFFVASLPREETVLFQSPQAFRRDVLEDVYARTPPSALAEQATWELAVALGVPVRAVPGEERNVKITHALDWALARALAEVESGSEAEAPGRGRGAG